MHRLVVLSDIHGNRWALEAVLADMETQPPDEIIVLGDLLADGPDPVGTFYRFSLAGSLLRRSKHPEKGNGRAQSANASGTPGVEEPEDLS